MEGGQPKTANLLSHRRSLPADDKRIAPTSCHRAILAVIGPSTHEKSFWSCKSLLVITVLRLASLNF